MPIYIYIVRGKENHAVFDAKDKAIDYLLSLDDDSTEIEIHELNSIEGYVGYVWPHEYGRIKIE